MSSRLLLVVENAPYLSSGCLSLEPTVMGPREGPVAESLSVLGGPVIPVTAS